VTSAEPFAGSACWSGGQGSQNESRCAGVGEVGEGEWMERITIGDRGRSAKRSAPVATIIAAMKEMIPATHQPRLIGAAESARANGRVTSVSLEDASSNASGRATSGPAIAVDG
jgi:hypothetical protein